MPICKRCHSRIDKFNKDRCPICGELNPFEGVSSDTIEVTTNIDTSNLDIDFHPRKKKTLLILFTTLGIFGVPFFYLYKKNVGIIYAIINLIVLAASLTLLLLLTSLNPFVVVFVTLISLIFINFLVGLYFYNLPNLKDGRGVFLA